MITYLILMLARNLVVWGKGIMYQIQSRQIGLFLDTCCDKDHGFRIKVSVNDLGDDNLSNRIRSMNNYTTFSIMSNRVMLRAVKTTTVIQVNILRTIPLVYVPMIFLLLTSINIKTKTRGRTIPFKT